MKTQMLINNPFGLNTLLIASTKRCKVDSRMPNGNFLSTHHEDDIIIVVEELD